MVADERQFKNADLVLRVSPAVDRAIWDESRYERFFEELCGTRVYQAEALRTALRYLLSGRYSTLEDLARENYESSPTLPAAYGSWTNLLRQLQLPEQLAASLDLATGVGKSYVTYGLAMVLLAEGVVDQVLVLCPSTTIERGLLTKFRELAANPAIRGALPANAQYLSRESITRQSQSRRAACAWKTTTLSYST